jgi:MFS family permease
LVVASGIFASGTVICASAWSTPAMVTGRAVQGLGSGLMISGAYGAVRVLVPENLWPRILAVISAAWGAASMTGPAVGGAFAGLGVWRPGFWMMVPVVLVVPALSWRMLGAEPPRAATRGGPSVACSPSVSPSSVWVRWPTSGRRRCRPRWSSPPARWLRWPSASTAGPRRRCFRGTCCRWPGH